MSSNLGVNHGNISVSSSLVTASEKVKGESEIEDLERVEDQTEESSLFSRVSYPFVRLSNLVIDVGSVSRGFLVDNASSVLSFMVGVRNGDVKLMAEKGFGLLGSARKASSEKKTKEENTLISRVSMPIGRVCTGSSIIISLNDLDLLDLSAFALEEVKRVAESSHGALEVLSVGAAIGDLVDRDRKIAANRVKLLNCGEGGEKRQLESDISADRHAQWGNYLNIAKGTSSVALVALSGYLRLNNPVVVIPFTVMNLSSKVGKLLFYFTTPPTPVRPVEIEMTTLRDIEYTLR